MEKYQIELTFDDLRFINEALGVSIENLENLGRSGTVRSHSSVARSLNSHIQGLSSLKEDIGFILFEIMNPEELKEKDI